jgi:prolyl oligopeptidase
MICCWFGRLLFASLFWIGVAAVVAREVRPVYPATRREAVVDHYHGVEVADPYRWLEADVRESEETAAWVVAQNAAARSYLDAIPARAEIRARLASLWDYERFSIPEKIAGGYLYSRNSGLQNQAVLYFATDYRGSDARVLIDPNAWTEDGTAALGGTHVSDDGRLLAYTRKEAGSDWSTVEFLEIGTGRVLPDRLEWVRHGNMVFNAAGDGLYYTRYPEPSEGEKYQALSLNPAIYFHRLGDPQSEDQLVYRRPDEPTWSFWLSRTDDNRYLVMSIHRSTDRQNQVLVRPAEAEVDAPFTTLIGDFDNQFALIGNVDSRLFFLTDYEAPGKRVVTLDAEPAGGAEPVGREALEEIVPLAEATLEDASLLSGNLICQYLEDVVSRVRVFSTTGELVREIELPGPGSAYGFGGQATDEETFFLFSSYVMPSTAFRYDLASGTTELIRSSQIEFDSASYESRQAFVTSKDGTQVPIIVSHRRGLPRDGQRPTLLYAYGGFSISLTPGFRVDYAAWMEMGGVLAIANLRGGGEYGAAWHAAGKKLNKQNVFDDFIAAAQWLATENYTSPAKLAVMGGSNGGLLVGAVVTQHPELFGAALPAVGVMDMLRYDQFTAGHFWRDEFGTTADPDEFRALLDYSPYHNAVPGTHYPATLVTTADTDDRVVPMHSFKFAAAVQHAQAGEAPVLLRVESRAGHGAGTPTSKQIDLAADKWAFLWQTLGMGENQAELSGEQPQGGD